MLHRPFCFKDPRFCYTLPVWRPHLGDAAFLCVFREPDRTVASILKECSEMRYLRRLGVTASWAYEVWALMYRHVVEIHRHEGDWIIAHFDQILDGSAIPRIEARIGAKLDTDFPDPALKRSPAAGDEPDEIRPNGFYIEHEDGTIGSYAHITQDGVLVEVGDYVEQGQVVAIGGTSGSYEPHLHFMVYQRYPEIVEDDDVPVNFRNADGPLDERGGLMWGYVYWAMPE